MSKVSVYKFVIAAVLLLLVIVGGDEQECNLSRTNKEEESPERCSASSSITPPTESACPIILRPELLEKLSTTEHPFHTVATMKVMGRLGNHMWSAMLYTALSMKYNLNMAMFKETKDYLKKYFKGFDHCQSLEEDYCGFEQFFEHFRDYLDSKIEQFYSEKSGHQVKFKRKGIQLQVPPEYGNTWKLNYKELIDTENFIKDYHPIKFSTQDCQYEWEIFRGEEELLTEDNWKYGRALLLHPGLKKIDEHSVFDSIPNFGDIFFSKMKFHDHFQQKASEVLHQIKDQHLAKQQKKVSKKKKTSKTSNASETGKDDFIFVGIHARGTDHIKYEQEKGFVSLKTAYYLDAMHMFRQHFRKASKKGHLVFLYVSDEMESGRAKLEPRNRDQDLYFVGDGDVDKTDAIGRDLAILASCNHTIESHGSYSFFAGALAGGYRIVPQHFLEYVGKDEVLLPNPFDKPLHRIYSRQPRNNSTNYRTT